MSLLYLFRSFQQQFYRKIVDSIGIRTRIVRVEGEHSDHLATIPSVLSISYSFSLNIATFFFYFWLRYKVLYLYICRISKFLKMCNPRPLFCLFRLFKISTFYETALSQRQVLLSLIGKQLS